MLECTLEKNSVVFGTVSWLVLPPEMLWKSFRRSSLSFQTSIRTRTVSLFMFLAQISLWTTWSHLATSKIDLWIHLDQPHMFLNTAESTSPCFFFKLIIDVVVLVIRHLEITKKTGASLGFGKNLLSASYIVFLMTVLTSMYNPLAPTLEEELNDMKEYAKKRRAPLPCNESGSVQPSHNSEFLCLIFFLSLFLCLTTFNFCCLW